MIYTHYLTYVSCKTTALWTFQDRIQSAPEARIRLSRWQLELYEYISHLKLTHRRGEEHERHDEYSRVQDVNFVIALCEELLLGVPGLLHNLFIKLVARYQPLIAPRARKRALVRKAEA